MCVEGGKQDSGHIDYSSSNQCPGRPFQKDIDYSSKVKIDMRMVWHAVWLLGIATACCNGLLFELGLSGGRFETSVATLACTSLDTMFCAHGPDRLYLRCENDALWILYKNGTMLTVNQLPDYTVSMAFSASGALARLSLNQAGVFYFQELGSPFALPLSISSLAQGLLLYADGAYHTLALCQQQLHLLTIHPANQSAVVTPLNTTFVTLVVLQDRLLGVQPNALVDAYTGALVLLLPETFSLALSGNAYAGALQELSTGLLMISTLWGYVQPIYGRNLLVYQNFTGTPSSATVSSTTTTTMLTASAVAPLVVGTTITLVVAVKSESIVLLPSSTLVAGLAVDFVPPRFNSITLQGGTLQLDLDGRPVQDGEVFTLFSYVSRTGEFDNIAVTGYTLSCGSVEAQALYTATEVRVTLVTNTNACYATARILRVI